MPVDAPAILEDSASAGMVLIPNIDPSPASEELTTQNDIEGKYAIANSSNQFPMQMLDNIIIGQHPWKYNQELLQHSSILHNTCIP